MLLHHYQAMARYNRWMNEKLYAWCAELPEQERKRDMGAFFRSIHGTPNHILLADHAWMRRFTDDAKAFEVRDASGNPIEVRSLGQELYANFAELRAVRQKSDAGIEGWVAGLREEYLLSPLRYRTSTGEEHEHPTWWALSHFFNHQTHHRGQVTTLLKQQGIDPGVTDLAVMLRGIMVGDTLTSCR
ncbi:MAG: DinB family protein [Polyangiales bacterium]